MSKSQAIAPRDESAARLATGAWQVSLAKAERDQAARTSIADLHGQALLALHERSQSGIFVHLLLWIVIGATTDLVATQPVFFWINAAVFACSLLARLILRSRYAKLMAQQPRVAAATLLSLLLVNALHWGILGCLGALWSALAAAQFPIWLTGCGIAASGTMTFAILPIMRLTYPLLLLAPVVIALLITRDGRYVFIAVSALVFAAYMFRASKAVRDDYWAAAYARFELEERARQLELLSTTDALTRVYNRHYFDHRLATEWSRAAREHSPLSVLLIDIDHFKRINDEHGHPFGDRCLRIVAAALKAALHRPTDLLARYGGEEFAVLLSATDSTAAEQTAQLLRESIAALVLDHEGRAVTVTCSVGLYTAMPRPGSSAASAVDAADQALYSAKQQGRNRVVTATPI